MRIVEIERRHLAREVIDRDNCSHVGRHRMLSSVYRVVLKIRRGVLGEPRFGGDCPTMCQGANFYSLSADDACFNGRWKLLQIMHHFSDFLLFNLCIVLLCSQRVGDEECARLV